MNAAVPSLTELIADGDWLAHRYDETRDTIEFRHFPRDSHRAATFLTDREVGAAPLAVYPRAQCLAEAQERKLAPARFIFHSAYCCSTLLARAFDIPGVAYGLKEPQILNDVVGLQLRRRDPRQIAAALDAALLLLSRPLGEDEVNVVKPSNLINPSLRLISAMRPDVRGLLLYAPLESFLVSIARKEIEGRAWTRELMWKLIHLGQAERFGFNEEELYRQTDLQAGAVAWLAQHALFVEAGTAHAGFHTLDSETLMRRPAECLAALGQLFELDFDAEAVACGPAFQRHSKDSTDYSAEQREAERERGRAAHAHEISVVLEWASRLAEHVALPMQLPRPLLGDRV